MFTHSPNGIVKGLRDLAGIMEGGPSIAAAEVARLVAGSLQWPSQDLRARSTNWHGGEATVTKAQIGSQPGAIFMGSAEFQTTDLLECAAFYAYHASVEWGLVAGREAMLVFNSHWLRRGSWFHLPPILWPKFESFLDLFEALTPEGLTYGRIEQVASRFYSPDVLLSPVDDALMSRLDFWRDEAVRYSEEHTAVDDRLHTLFAQLFVLRAAEDRGLAPQVEPLSAAIDDNGALDRRKVDSIFRVAKQYVQSELFEVGASLKGISDSVVAGIVQDLYYPSHLPGAGLRYNFAWIDADVLGRAYEKYLATLPIGVPTTRTQLSLFDEPSRDVQRVSVRKAAGIYYTPQYLVDFLTDYCLERYFLSLSAQAFRLPHVLDSSCGSGSFLIAAVNHIIKTCRDREPKRNWGRELISQKCIIGVDKDRRAVMLARLSLWLRFAEEPDPLPLPELEAAIVQGDALSDQVWAGLPEAYDVVLGNPPFIPFGFVPSRAALANRFRAATGRFDYSYLFVELAIAKLCPRGHLGLVVPTRVFRNRDASPLRAYFTESCRLLSVNDFGSNEVFRGTAAYIGTVVGEKSASDSPDETYRYTRVTRVTPRFMGLLLTVAASEPRGLSTEYLRSYDVRAPHGPAPWLFLSRTSMSARIRLEDRSVPLIDEADIFQGIKTGANDLFVLTIESELDRPVVSVRNGLGDAHLLETELLHPVMYGSEIKEYCRARPTRVLVYPYKNDSVIEESELRARLPLTYKYFSAYRALLEGRSSLLVGRQLWYELIRKREMVWLNSQKLLIRDLATRPAFAIDDIGPTYLIGGSAVVPHDSALLTPLLGYLNSAMVNWYLQPTTAAFRAGFQKFEQQDLEKIPVLRDVLYDEALRDTLTRSAEALIEAKHCDDQVAVKSLQMQINQALARVIGLDTEEIG